MIDPRHIPIPEAVLEVLPATVAVETCVLPFRLEGDRVWLFCPSEHEFIAREEERLAFILNRRIEWEPVETTLLKEALAERYAPWFEATIENCQPRFRYRCPKTWSSLEPTAEPHVRHCAECQRPVRWCENDRVAEELGRRGECVALAVMQYVESMGIVEFDD